MVSISNIDPRAAAAASPNKAHAQDSPKIREEEKSEKWRGRMRLWAISLNHTNIKKEQSRRGPKTKHTQTHRATDRYKRPPRQMNMEKWRKKINK